MATLVALNVPISSLSYGVVSASSTTGSSTQLLNIENAGNASTTIKVNGTAFTSGSYSLATSSQHYATSSFTYGGGETALTDTATTITGINIPPAFKIPLGGTGWQNTTALPYTDKEHTSAAYNGYLYTVGGWANEVGETSTVLFAQMNATGSIGAWTSTQALPYASRSHTSIAYNGYLYTIGGGYVNTTSSIFVETSTVLFAPINATGSIGAWTSTQALPYAIKSHTSVAYNGYLYTIGGQASTSASVADTSTVLFAQINATGSLGAWTSTQALPYPVYGDRDHTSVAYNGYLYNIGGLAATSSVTSTVFFAPINATGSIGAWTSTQALPYADGDHTSVVYNDYIYTIGGCAGAPNCSYTSTVLFTPLSARSTYWGVGVTSTVVNGNYTAITTFTAVFSP